MMKFQCKQIAYETLFISPNNFNFYCFYIVCKFRFILTPHSGTS